AWAGTPGTVGGAIFGNAHFNGRLIGDLVVEARLVSAEGAVVDVPAASMAFGYDRSRLQRSAETLLSAVFRVAAGEPAALRATAADVKRLIDECRAAVRDRFGVALREEIVYLGEWDSGFGIRDSGFA